MKIMPGRWNKVGGQLCCFSLGDFNTDSFVNDTDIDLLREAIYTNDTRPHFDANEDSFVNNADLDYLVEVTGIRSNRHPI